MTQEATPEESLAAILGFILLLNDGEIRIPAEMLDNGLPEGSGVRVEYNEEAEELVVSVARRDA